MVELDLDTILDIADQPGTYLRTARCLDFLRPEMRVHAANNIREMGIEGIVVIGGDGSYHGAMGLCELGIPCVGIPGTIDNDLAYTEMTLGYDTAVNSCIDDIRSIRATSRSHDRPGVVEVMGRHCGDIALKAAAGSGAEICLVPEVPWSDSGGRRPPLPPDRHGQPARDRRRRRRRVGLHAALPTGSRYLIEMRREGHPRGRPDHHREARPAAQVQVQVRSASDRARLHRSAAARRPPTTAGSPSKPATSPSTCCATASAIRSSASRMDAFTTCPSRWRSSRSANSISRSIT